MLANRFLQLAFWGEKVVQGRTLELEKSAAGVSQTVTVQLPKPATLSVMIDPTTFPDAGRIRLSRPQEAFFEYEQQLAADQKELKFEYLPPGEYAVFV